MMQIQHTPGRKTFRNIGMPVLMVAIFLLLFTQPLAAAQIMFLPDYSDQEKVTFVDNDADNDFVQITFDNVMGRVAIPSIGTISPLYSVNMDQSVNLQLVGPRIWEWDWGSGILPLAAGEALDVDYEYIDSIYMHRVLTKTTGALYLDQLKPGDPFYVDNFTIGKRIFYHVQETKIVPVEEFWEEHSYFGVWDYGKMLSPYMLLVTCHPFIYDASNERVVVLAEATGETRDIPEDAIGYQDYKQKNGME